MNTCTRCPAPARWRDGDGRQFCGSHVPANGKPLARLPVAPEPDIIERLLESSPTEDLCREAAGEIRRLRAELDKSGSC